MITTLLFNILFAPIFLLLAAIVPMQAPSIPDSYFQTVLDFIKTARYVFPIRDCCTILSLSFGLSNLKLFWTIFLRIKSLIPTWGN